MCCFDRMRHRTYGGVRGRSSCEAPPTRSTYEALWCSISQRKGYLKGIYLEFSLEIQGLAKQPPFEAAFSGFDKRTEIDHEMWL